MQQSVGFFWNLTKIQPKKRFWVANVSMVRGNVPKCISLLIISATGKGSNEAAKLRYLIPSSPSAFEITICQVAHDIATNNAKAIDDDEQQETSPKRCTKKSVCTKDEYSISVCKSSPVRLEIQSSKGNKIEWQHGSIL